MRKTLCLTGFASAVMFVSTGFTQPPAPPTAVPYAMPLPPQQIPTPVHPLAYFPATVPAVTPALAEPHSQPMPTLPRPVPAPSLQYYPASITVPAEPMTTKVIDIADVILQTGSKGSRDASEDRARRLVHFLEGYVAPATWTDAGGKGSMVYFATNHTLVVNNQATVVKEIESWIDRMRVASKPTVAVSIVQFRCESGALAKLGIDAKKTTCLTTAQCDEAIKALKADRSIEILTAPQMALVDNQTGFFQIGQDVAAPAPSGQAPVTVGTTFVGSTIRATPRLAPDGTTIQVRIESECSHIEPAKPAPDVFLRSQTTDGNTHLVRVLSKPPEAPCVKSHSVTSTFTVPQGGTALVPMGRQTMTERTEWKVPVLGDVPVVDCLFRGRCTEEKDCDLFMLVTASLMTGSNAESKPPMVQPKPVRLVEAVMLPLTKPTSPTACELVSLYHKACAEGRTDDAKKLATAALALDPKCFTEK